MNWYLKPAKAIDHDAVKRAVARQNSLTKPPGSLGQLEQTAVRLCGMMGDRPNPDRPAIVVFAADHGVADENVSAFPQVVTGEMVRNFANGGAAICVLARASEASLEVVQLGTVNDPGELPGVVREIIAPASGNLLQQPAMDNEQLEQAMKAGKNAVERAQAKGRNIFIGGDMGIANTTAATAIICQALSLAGEDVAGPGTGLDAVGVRHKAEVVDQAIALHGDAIREPIDMLRCLGGFEIAALAGAYIAAAQHGMPTIVDGFIASSAALAAVRINPDAANWMLLSHISAEPGYAPVQHALEEVTGSTPLISLAMRLGEGSGAATVIPVIRNACRLHNEMATFGQAGVSEGSLPTPGEQ